MLKRRARNLINFKATEQPMLRSAVSIESSTLKTAEANPQTAAGTAATAAAQQLPQQ